MTSVPTSGVPTRTTFTHHDVGTAESQWTQDPRLATLARLRVPGAAEHLLVLAAHPDDETLGAGGLIATAADLGARVDVLIASNGEASHPSSATHTADELAALRRGEVRDAVAELAPAATVTLLDLPDGRLADNQGAITGAVAARLTSRTVLVTPWWGDRHPDHEACSRAGSTALLGRANAQWQYPIWLWHWGRPSGPDLPWEQAGAVDLDAPARAAKRRAIARHRSQHEPLSAHPGDEAILPTTFLAHFERTYETFLIDPFPSEPFPSDPFPSNPQA